MSGGNRPNSNYVLYGNPMPNFNVRKDRVVNSIRVTDPTTLHLPSASILDIDPQSPHPPGEGNNDPVTNSTLRGSDNMRGIPQAGALVYCSTPIEKKLTPDACFDGRNHLYFSDGKNWIPLANCLPKTIRDPQPVNALGLTVLRGRRGSPLSQPLGPLNAPVPITGSNAQMGLAAGATEVIVPPSWALPGLFNLASDTGVLNVIPWQGFDVNSFRPNGTAGNQSDITRWPLITNPRPDEFLLGETKPKGYVDFKIPENGLFHVKFQGYFEYRADSNPGELKATMDAGGLEWPANASAGINPNLFPWGFDPQEFADQLIVDGEQLYLGLIFTDADDTINPFRESIGLPIWNHFFSAPRRIFRETVFTQSEIIHPPEDDDTPYQGAYRKGMGRMVHCEWTVDSANVRASPLAQLAPPWLWNLNPGRFKPGQTCRVWPVTSSNCIKASPPGQDARYPLTWDSVKFQWKYGGKFYSTGRDYPDIKIEVDGVPDNFQEDAPNPPPGANLVPPLAGPAAM